MISYPKLLSVVAVRSQDSEQKAQPKVDVRVMVSALSLFG